ncbi:Gldg family protein [Candidatus Parabeggiatoa sp. HSG14]|uniref:GldG family protein n=1 Tax=Candidatus Parabeggiatoa sp. HSG14 TaxID=3055593 RepID=UPI0025A7AFF4|nr:Gldg family protein [Thiotrichales bacterium HSG14]
MNQKILTTSGLFIAIALFLAVNIISDVSLKSARLDLTEGQLYTLSEGSKNILENLEEPITLRLFLSQKVATNLPGISSYTVRVRELLEEYQRAAGGKLKLMVIDPEPFSDEEDRAEGFGLQGVPVDDSNTTFYFGLAGTNSTDDEDTIPFFTPNREEFLEYDLTKLVYQLAYPEEKTVGIMSTLPLQGSEKANPFAPQAEEPWMIIDHIKQLVTVETVATDVEKIPDNINVLMIIHPKGFSDATLYAIDQFVLNGGRAIIFADPYSEVYQPPSDPKNPFAAMQAPRNSEMSKLFETWGIEIASDQVIGDLQVAQKVQVRKGSKVSVINYPVWMDLDNPQYFNEDDIVTGKLGNIVLATPGAIEKKGDVGTEIVPLIETGDRAMQIATTKLGFFADTEDLIRDFKSQGKFTIAARVTGKVKTAFPEGKPESEEEGDEDSPPEEETDSEHLTESALPINIIVVADTDMLEDKFWVRVQNFIGQRIAMPHAANATFISNALDNLSGSNDLISVRNRGSFARPFTKVEEIQQKAEKRFREKEKKLLANLQETDQKIRDLQKKKTDGNKLMLDVRQQQEIENFRNEKIKFRKELRNVQHELRKNVEGLETWMKFVNIGFMPLLIGFFGISFSFLSRRRKV